MSIRSLAVMFLLPVMACSADAPAGPDYLPGTYLLRTVNGSPPPVTIFANEANTRQITGATITLHGGRTCRLESQYRDLRVGADGWTPDLYDLACTYALDGPRLQVVQENGVGLAMSWAGDRITYAASDITLVFEREAR